MDTRLYQLFKRVKFEISSDEALTRKIITPLVEEFQKRLQAVKFEEGSFKAWIEVADDLHCNFTAPTVATGSFRISIELRDKEYDGSARRFNQFEFTVLANRLKELNFIMNNLALEVKS